MTLAMPDSTNVNSLPVGYDAYLGYVDGDFQTAAALEGLFPGAQLVLLTVTAGTLKAGGVDIEPGNMNAAQGAYWIRDKLAQDPASRPVAYASVEGQPGYGMDDLLQALFSLRIGRDEVRLLSAHYGAGPHICGPDSCKLISTEMDGTQWTNQYRETPSAPVIDMSMLQDSFFGTLTETERLVQELGTVKQGQTGNAVKTVQGLCNARGATLKIDGVFGVQTLSAVKFTQSTVKGIAVDGIVGPQTWPALLGIA